MGGVDLMVQNVSNYRTNTRSKKWWRPLLAYTVEVSVQNSTLLYSLSPSYGQQPLDLDSLHDICQVYDLNTSQYWNCVITQLLPLASLHLWHGKFHNADKSRNATCVQVYMKRYASCRPPVAVPSGTEYRFTDELLLTSAWWHWTLPTQQLQHSSSVVHVEERQIKVRQVQCGQVHQLLPSLPVHTKPNWSTLIDYNRHWTVIYSSIYTSHVVHGRALRL